MGPSLFQIVSKWCPTPFCLIHCIRVLLIFRIASTTFPPSSLPCTCCNRRCALFFSSWLYQWTPPPTKTAPIAMRRPRPMAGRRTWTCHDVGEDEAGPVPTTRHVAAPRMTTSDTIGRITATSRHCHGATTDNDDEDLRQTKLVVVCCVHLFAVWCSGHCRNLKQRC